MKPEILISTGIGIAGIIGSLLVVSYGFGLQARGYEKDIEHLSEKVITLQNTVASNHTVSAKQLDEAEQQLMQWNENTQKQAKENLEIIITAVDDNKSEIETNRKEINNQKLFLIRKFPEFQTYN
jgi:uncharacterized membrane protein YhiD involved in acid resistance